MQNKTANGSSEKPIVLITGGGRGIGAATARQFALNGYTVCINYHSDARSAESLAQALSDEGATCYAQQADVSQEADVLRLFHWLDDQVGRLDVLVNNAGILQQQMPLLTMSGERMRQVLLTNVLGSLLCCREAIKRMSTAQGGRGGAIINVSSVAARTGSPNEYVDYAASKGALDTLTRGLAVEVAGQGIRVNAVRPGFIRTDMHAAGGEPERLKRLAPLIPMQRGGEPEEVAEAIVWLASEAASYVSGSFLDIAGGR